MPSPESYDCIVIGAGAAGIPAALAAADGGARVLVLEKRPVVGGMLHVSGGQFSGANTRRQRDRGIVDTPDDHFHDVVRIAHGKADPALVRISVDIQGEMVDWLDDLGFDFHADTPKLAFGHEVYQIPRTYHGVRNGRSLLRLFEQELQRRVAAGTIDLRVSMRVTDLLRDNSGRVIGARAVPVDPQGDPIGPSESFVATNILLATGGFAANPDLVNRFAPPHERGFLAGCLDYAVGDGLVLAERIGAQLTEYVGTLPSLALIPDPARPGFTVFWHQAHVVLPPQVRTPHEIWVDVTGKRFMREDSLSAEERDRALLMVPQARIAIVWDQHILDTTPPIIDSDDGDWTRERIMTEAERGGLLWKADTLEALADKLGVNPAGLAETVARYNQMVAAQHDPDFGRAILPTPIGRAPFYGVVSQAGMLLSREGILTDIDLRVLDAAGAPIPGLYAVGEVLGAARLMGDSFASGMSVGPAIALGRRIGRYFAEEVGQRAVGSPQSQ